MNVQFQPMRALPFEMRKKTDDDLVGQPGSYYPIKMTAQQLAEFYWGMKKVSVKINLNISGSSTSGEGEDAVTTTYNYSLSIVGNDAIDYYYVGAAGENEETTLQNFKFSTAQKAKNRADLMNSKFSGNMLQNYANEKAEFPNRFTVKQIKCNFTENQSITRGEDEPDVINRSGWATFSFFLGTPMSSNINNSGNLADEYGSGLIDEPTSESVPFQCVYDNMVGDIDHPAYAKDFYPYIDFTTHYQGHNNAHILSRFSPDSVGDGVIKDVVFFGFPMKIYIDKFFVADESKSLTWEVKVSEPWPKSIDVTTV